MLKLRIKATNTNHDRHQNEEGVKPRFVLGVIDKIIEGDVPKKVSNVAISGFFSPMVAGNYYMIEGELEVSAKGSLIKAKSVTDDLDYGLDFPSFERTLKSILSKVGVKGLRSKVIHDCFQEYGSDSFMALTDEHTATRFFGNKGSEIAKAVSDKTNIADLSAYLHQKGFDITQSDKLMKRFGNRGAEIKRVIENDPYKLALMRIAFIGFKTIDAMALKQDRSLFDSDARIAAGIMYVIDSAVENKQHCYLTNRQLFSGLFQDLGFRATINARFLENEGIEAMPDELNYIMESNPPLKSKYNKFLKPFKEKVGRNIERLLEDSIIKRRWFDSDSGGEGAGYWGYYSPKIFHMENYVANKVKSMATMESEITESSVKAKLDEILASDNVELSDEQYSACVNSLKYKLSVLTGSAGTGKTFTLKYILKLFKAFDIQNPIICAPTGKAADRASKVAGIEGGTVHRILGFQGTKFLKNETNPLETELTLLDESSMVDLELFYRLLLAMPDDAHLVLIGDPNQLPSVGAGYVLGDIIEAGINVSRLTKVRRQGEGSLLDFVDDIRQGIAPRMADCLSDGFDWSKKPQVVSTTFDAITRKGKNYDEVVIDFLTDTVPNIYGYTDYQSLTAMKNGDYQSGYNNNMLRKALNSANFLEYEVETKDRKVSFKAGDRVIHTINNPKLGIPEMDDVMSGCYDEIGIDSASYGVFNGEVGTVKYVNPEEKLFSVEYPNGKGGIKTLQYLNMKEQCQVEQAWNITVHKSQGSEYEVVVLVLPSSSAYMIDRTLLYTGATRASKLLFVIYGHLSDGQSIIDYAVKQNKAERRNTALASLIKYGCEVEEKVIEDE